MWAHNLHKHVFGSYNSGIAAQDEPFHPFTPDESLQQTPTQMRTYLIQNRPDPHEPVAVPSGTITSPRRILNSSNRAHEIYEVNKREIAAYPSLKDERYFDGFKRSLFIVATCHKCNEVLDPTYTAGSEPEQQELFEAKQTFMCSVFNANLQTDIGKTIVRCSISLERGQCTYEDIIQRSLREEKTHPICHQNYCSR